MDPDIIERAIEALQAVPGFDCHEGVERIFGNRELYYKLLLLFFNADHPSAIRRALEAGDAGAIGRVHALKGAALNMGFRGIAALADEIGTSLKGGHMGQAWDTLGKLEDMVERAVEAVRSGQAGRGLLSGNGDK